MHNAQVGIHDDFLDLGGNSLAATRVMSRVVRKFELNMPIQILFRAPTVAEMAAEITQSQAKKLGEKDLVRALIELES